MSDVNDTMRDTFIGRMAAAGKPLERVEGLHGKTQLYRMPDGKTVLIRTNKKHRAMIAKADGPRVEDEINIEKFSPDFVGPTVFSADQNDFDCYLIPTAEACDAMRANHVPHVAKHPDTTSDVRIINFNEPEIEQRFGRYRIEPRTAQMRPTVTSRNARSLDQVVAEARRMVAQAAARPESAITISIAY
jgi:hypothetical protein